MAVLRPVHFPCVHACKVNQINKRLKFNPMDHPSINTGSRPFECLPSTRNHNSPSQLLGWSPLSSSPLSSPLYPWLHSDNPDGDGLSDRSLAQLPSIVPSPYHSAQC
ncbi:unnamed protein product [Pleuronectes platessa]|uniref:Uncharacterized protein n=1 Tax=Pleuronectes platessa TaxID=8262 RepID=A0A9N7VXS1_PLEPL|nr:unnamed protein product [Pleuronectes platessa]